MERISFLFSAILISNSGGEILLFVWTSFGQKTGFQILRDRFFLLKGKQSFSLAVCSLRAERRGFASARARLALTSTAIKSGIIKFPRKGCEELIEQLVGFGVEKHDDLADAFSLLVNSTMDKHANEGTVIMWFLGYGDDDDDIIYYSDYVDVE